MTTDGFKVPSENPGAFSDPATLGFETTDERSPLEGTIGQERAISTLELGLDINEPGFNIFISAPPRLRTQHGHPCIRRSHSHRQANPLGLGLRPQLRRPCPAQGHQAALRHDEYPSA